VPICEIDPWRKQYFERVSCPDDVFIPTEDSDAWLWNPNHRWVYDKLAVASRQGLDCAPHGVSPTDYPVFSKPIYNLKGMGVGSQALYSKSDYEAAYRPGHMWMTLLAGEHVSSDVALVNGVPRWWRHARGVAAGVGMRKYFPVVEGAVDISVAIAAWPTSKRSAEASSRCISGLPTNGPISMARDGSRLSSDFTETANGVSRTVRAEPDTASSSSCRMGAGIATRHAPCSTESRACQACRASRSPSMRKSRRSVMRCHPAASG